MIHWLRCLNETEREVPSLSQSSNSTHKMELSSSVNLNVLRVGIKRHGICGSTLDQMDRNDWIHVGVQLLEDRIQIHDRIRAMVEKYPRPRTKHKKQSVSMSTMSHLTDLSVCGP